MRAILPLCILLSRDFKERNFMARLEAKPRGAKRRPPSPRINLFAAVGQTYSDGEFFKR